MPLLDAIRALASFDPPRELPRCDLDRLVAVLDAHGLAPLASYHLETRLIGAGVPHAFRERLLAVYTGVVNDNVFKLVTLKGALRGSGVPVVLLGAASYVDWLYPHLAFRPIGEPRLSDHRLPTDDLRDGLLAAGWVDLDNARERIKADHREIELVGTDDAHIRQDGAKSGVEFFVCGQYLAAEKIAPKSLTPDVTLAADALLVLIHYQNQGYAVPSF